MNPYFWTLTSFYPFFKRWILILILLVVLIIIYNNYTKTFIDGFETQNYSWSPELIKQFNIYQKTMNNNINQFDLNILQKQASSQEVEELLKTGYWPWTDDIKNEYIEKIWSSPIIKIDPVYALNYAMSVYNQNAATQLLAWNSKEGQFLLYGGLSKDMNNTLKCVTDSDGNSKMEKKVYDGEIFTNSTVTTVKSEDIPNEMPGFSFVKEPCDPCSPLNSEPEFNCPFKLNTNGDDSISLPWKRLWGL
jgi:hypothetical protein